MSALRSQTPPSKPVACDAGITQFHAPEAAFGFVGDVAPPESTIGLGNGLRLEVSDALAVSFPRHGLESAGIDRGARRHVAVEDGYFGDGL